MSCKWGWLVWEEVISYKQLLLWNQRWLRGHIVEVTLHSNRKGHHPTKTKTFPGTGHCFPNLKVWKGLSEWSLALPTASGMKMIIFFFMCISVLPVYVCAVVWNWSYRHLGAAMWMLRINLGPMEEHTVFCCCCFKFFVFNTSWLQFPLPSLL